MQRVVELTLVNLSPNVERDMQGDEFPHIASNSLSSCATAQNMLQNRSSNVISKFFRKGKQKESNDDSLSNKLIEGTMRFVQVKDKYTALSSILLKSHAFYKAHGDIMSQYDNDDELPVVDLPRTDKGKPFIPTSASALETECNTHSISVSHQFPYCGIARLINSESNVNNIMVGMDIVVFEPLRTDLYKTVDDFLLVFRESFTDWEWQQIMQSPCPNERLYEFYLRWSIKEAYTKALGLGLFLEFGRFETRLDEMDEGEHAVEQGIWSLISANREGIHLNGCVRVEGKEASDWEFFFLPLINEDSEEFIGCACVCLGPLTDTGDTSFEERTTWTTLDNVIQRHKDNYT